jgi:hypothetical protein
MRRAEGGAKILGVFRVEKKKKCDGQDYLIPFLKGHMKLTFHQNLVPMEQTRRLLCEFRASGSLNFASLSGININFHLKSSIVFNLYKVCQ